MAEYGLQGLRGLLEDWLRQAEEQILEFVIQKRQVDAKVTSEEFKVSLKNSAFVLGKLAKEGKLNLSIGVER